MKIIINFIKGIVIGIATLIPGVSGGTMAIILGIYDDLIHSVSSFLKDIKKNIIFLGVIGIGAIVGMKLLSSTMTYSLEHFKLPTIYLFLGVILGGLPVLYKEANKGKKNKLDYLYIIIGIAIVLIMTFDSVAIVNLATSTGIVKNIFLIIAGIIIAVALILPGISTSFLLLTLGLYDITLKAIENVDIGYLIPVGIGGLLGVVVTTKILEKFMKEKPRQTYLLILGFVLGSIPEVFPGLPSGLNIIVCLITLALGFLIIRYMSKKEK